MGEQTSSDEPNKIGSAKPPALNKERTRVPRFHRLREYAKTWWRERGGPGGVTDAYMQSVDAIHAAIPPGVTEEAFRWKIRPILEAQAKVAGYAAMVGEVTLSALTTAWFVQRGRRSARRFETTMRESVDAAIDHAAFQRAFDDYRDQPSQFVDSTPTTVIDAGTMAIIPGDSGFRRSRADDIVDSLRLGGRIVSTVGGAVIRGSGTLAGIATGAAILERGPVHAAAKLGARAEGAVGTAVVKITDRIVRGWQRPDGKIAMTKPQALM